MFLREMWSHPAPQSGTSASLKRSSPLRDRSIGVCLARGLRCVYTLYRGSCDTQTTGSQDRRPGPASDHRGACDRPQQPLYASCPCAGLHRTSGKSTYPSEGPAASPYAIQASGGSLPSYCFRELLTHLHRLHLTSGSGRAAVGLIYAS